MTLSSININMLLYDWFLIKTFQKEWKNRHGLRFNRGIGGGGILGDSIRQFISYILDYICAAVYIQGVQNY